VYLYAVMTCTVDIDCVQRGVAVCVR